MFGYAVKSHQVGMAMANDASGSAANEALFGSVVARGTESRLVNSHLVFVEPTHVIRCSKLAKDGVCVP